jgi:adenylate kinase
MLYLSGRERRSCHDLPAMPVPQGGTRRMRLVLLGPPGAGKGTQAVHIAAATSAPHIATGDIFREHVRAETPLGRTAKEHMDRGELVPDEIVIGMVTGRICAPDAAGGFVLDGFPRTVAQAEALEAYLAETATPLDAVLRFDVCAEQVVDRIVERRTCPADGSVFHLRFAPPAVAGRCDACGSELVQRPDDTEEVVRHRLAEYQAKTAPLEAFYADRSILVSIDAEGPVAQVTGRALAVIERLRSVDDVRVDRVVDVTGSPVTAAAAGVTEPPIPA